MLAPDRDLFVGDRLTLLVNDLALEAGGGDHHKIEPAGLARYHHPLSLTVPVVAFFRQLIAHQQATLTAEVLLGVGRLEGEDRGRLNARAPGPRGVVAHSHARSEAERVLALFVGDRFSRRH